MTLAQITSTEWQLSTAAPGLVVQGVDDINQCIGTIICTLPGSDPMRPLFGCGLPILVDRPSHIVGAAMAVAIDKALRIWEPRIRVMKISYRVAEHQIFFSIAWQLKIGYTAGQVEIPIGLGNGSGQGGNDAAAPYLSAAISTEALEPITTESGDILKQ